MSNPYKSPSTESCAENSETIPEKRPLYLWVSGVLMCYGAFSMLLLDGQVFFHAVQLLVLTIISALIWVNAYRSYKYRKISIYVLLGHMGLAIALAKSLPENYQFQLRFNARTEEIKQQGFQSGPTSK